VKKGNIIFLNGTSSSGKGSIAKALQPLLDSPYVHMSIDSFLYMLRDGYGFDDIETLFQKVSGDSLISGFHHCIRALSLAGHHEIVDHVLEYPYRLEECVDLLMDHPVVFVGVRCPLDELERRERKRGDRQIGLARWQFDRVHAHEIYDLEVDTSVKNPEECAIQIKEYLQQHPAPDALKRIKETVEFSIS
jgi:chloramphenicol 3-O phosphotransferase